jgi:AcrR family transcriptional regulator
MIDVSRPYQLKQRAERQLETRQRIVEATIELHQTIGPAATTITEISERAGVGRVTVYRHFPEPLSLDRACSGLYFQRNPAPDPDDWRRVGDPVERLRLGLTETYTYHARTEQMISRALADARDHPVMAPYHDHWSKAVRVLLEPWPARGKRRKQLQAALALAVSFDTWRTLVREQGLSQSQAIELIERLTATGVGIPQKY